MEKFVNSVTSVLRRLQRWEDINTFDSGQGRRERNAPVKSFSLEQNTIGKIHKSILPKLNFWFIQ